MSAATMTHTINLNAPRERRGDIGKRVRLVYGGERTSAALVEFEDGGRTWISEDCLTPIGEVQA